MRATWLAGWVWLQRDPRGKWVGIALAATIAMAAVSYHWLETPFLRLKERFAHVLSRPGG